MSVCDLIHKRDLGLSLSLMREARGEDFSSGACCAGEVEPLMSEASRIAERVISE